MPYKDPSKQSSYQNEWLKNRRLKWLVENGPCIRCGSAEDLQVDHIDAGAKVTHRVWSWSNARRAAELAKCQVLCRSCHSRKTAESYEVSYGECHVRAKLTQIQVLVIKARYATGRETLRGLAREYGVVNSHIHRIVHGQKRSKG